MKRNTRRTVARTHEGAPGKWITTAEELRRSVLACLLWEDSFYESGVSIADRIIRLIPHVRPDDVFNLAVEARHQMKLRHVPLLLAREMARHDTHKGLVGSLLPYIVQRADELAEFMALYWEDGKTPISNQVKKGLAASFHNFDAYQFAKYDRDGAVKLRDVMFMVRPKPANQEETVLFRQIADGTLATPDTWEVALSAGASKRETWERLISEGKLGALALLRNLRNMAEVGVDEQLIFEALVDMNVERVLPFRFISAARYAPQWEPQIERAMLKCLSGMAQLPGKTILLVDVSGSMHDRVSHKSDLMRYDAANGLAILARELCEEIEIYSFSSRLVRIPNRRGFALRDAIVSSQRAASTELGEAVAAVNQEEYDRLIVLTDEQSSDPVPDPKGLGYMINVASYQNGVGYGAWTHIDGWSENVFRYITAMENEDERDHSG